MKRLFTFGCSFTQYIWPTWADILGREFDHFENWGKTSAGNSYIYHSIIECIATQKLTPNDTVIVMWTAADREDRYLNNKWVNYGPLHHNHGNKLSKEYIRDFYDLKGFLLRDISYIIGIKNILENNNIPYEFLWMCPIDFIDLDSTDDRTQLLDQFKDQIGVVCPSMFELVYQGSWIKPSRFSKPIANQKQQQLLKNQYNTMAGNDWPSFDDFKNNNMQSVDMDIQNEIASLGLTNLRDSSIREDNHPEPIWQLDYLNQVLPQYEISQPTIDWVNSYKDGDQFDPHFPKFRI